MPKILPDLIYKKESGNAIVDSENSTYLLPYFKAGEYFDNYESYVKFVKGCEKLVRNNDRYKNYIRYLKNEVKMDHCQVLKNVSDEDADIEMHHMPLNLFEICEVIIEYFLSKSWKISTARIADAVLSEHENNRVGVVMVSSTVHEEWHAGNIWIPYKMIYGDVPAFIKKYKDVISNDIKESINRYIDNSMLHEDANDFDILKINPDIYDNKKYLKDNP